MSRRLVAAGRILPFEPDHFDDRLRGISLEVVDEASGRIAYGRQVVNPSGLPPELVRRAVVWSLDDLFHHAHLILQEES